MSGGVLDRALDWASSPPAMLGTVLLAISWGQLMGTPEGWHDAVLVAYPTVLTQAIYRAGQRRDAVMAAREKAEQAKTNALIEATPGADNALAGREREAGELT